MNQSVLNVYLFVPIDDVPNHLKVKRMMCAVFVSHLCKASQSMHHHYHRQALSFCGSTIASRFLSVCVGVEVKCGVPYSTGVSNGQIVVCWMTGLARRCGHQLVAASLARCDRRWHIILYLLCSRMTTVEGFLI